MLCNQKYAISKVKIRMTSFSYIGLHYETRGNFYGTERLKQIVNRPVFLNLIEPCKTDPRKPHKETKANCDANFAGMKSDVLLVLNN